ncbi:MAG: penicillin-binding protein 2 [Verrucomicrobiota bacterium]
MLILSLLSARLFFIESFHGEKLAAKARAHYEYREELPAQRGRIFDRSGELLARNQTVFSLVVDSQHLRDLGLASIGLGRAEEISSHLIRKKYLPQEIQGRYREYVAECLSPLLREPKQELARRLREKEVGPLVLAKGIEDDFAERLEELIEAKALAGIYLKKGQRRYYPSPLSLTQVIGFVDADGVGASGVEKTFDSEMTGIAGYRYCERDSRRREIHAYRGLQVDPQAGRDVYLTIDMALQSVLERELDAVIDEYRPEKVTAIWMDPRNGEVLAMASRPHFDLATREGIRGMDPVRRNIAITDLYQPGSTFKIVGYSGAFDRGLATPAMEVDCHMGNYDREGFVLKDHHDYGRLSAEMAFAKSSNIGAYLVSRPLNKQVFHHYMNEFGFGKKTGIELNAESEGRIFPVSKWTATSFSSQVMGYEVAVTPLQMATACSVIANGGALRPPTILKGVKESRRGSVMVGGLNAPERRIISKEAAGQVRRCMIAAVGEGGTGSNAALPGYTVAGKTGTARKHVENVGYVSGRYIASFMGFLPAENPELVGLIVIDDPRLEGSEVYGGSVAAPFFKQVAKDAVKILGIEPDKPGELAPVIEDGIASVEPLGGGE